MPSNPETRLQIVVYEYLCTVLPRDAVVWATLNEQLDSGAGTREARQRRGAFLKKMGRVAGIPDLYVLWDSVLYGVELKRPAEPRQAKGRQSPAQQATQRRLEAAGARYGVCHSTDDVARFLASYGVPINDKTWRAA